MRRAEPGPMRPAPPGGAASWPLALRFGVQAETIERWRAQALERIEGALRTGNARSEREQTLRGTWRRWRRRLRVSR